MKIAFVLASCAACVEPPPERAEVPRAADWVQSADGARCATVRIAADQPVGVRALRVDFTGEDRVALYRASDATPACAALGMGAPLIVATPRQRELVLPDGVAFELGADQPLVIEAGPGVELSTIEVELRTGPYDAAARVTHVALPPVAIGPNAAKTVDGAPAMPDELDGATYFAFVGHTGRLGAAISAAITTTPFIDRVPVYLPAAFVWSAPPTQVIPARATPPGGRLYLQCTFYNTAAVPVDGELCGLWAYTR